MPPHINVCPLTAGTDVDTGRREQDMMVAGEAGEAETSFNHLSESWQPSAPHHRGDDEDHLQQPTALVTCLICSFVWSSVPHSSSSASVHTVAPPHTSTGPADTRNHNCFCCCCLVLRQHLTADLMFWTISTSSSSSLST